MGMRLPRLRPDQFKIMTTGAETSVVAMGRRWGKTLMAGSSGLAFAARGAAVGWIAPTYRNARPMWRFIEQYADGFANVNKSEFAAKFNLGGWLGVYTDENPTAIRGESFDVVFVDEAAMISDETWVDVIQPTLADRAGRAFLLSTPKGKNWFWREWMNARADTTGKTAAHNAPSCANPNPNIRAAYEKAKTRVSARTFQQEWNAEFIDDGGVIFRDVAAVSTLEPGAPEPGHEYVIGRDWARYNDGAVSSVWDIQTRDEVWLEIEYGVPYGLQISRLKELATHWNDALVIGETNGLGDPLIEQSAAAGIRIDRWLTTNLSKSTGVDGLALEIERRQCRLQNNPVGILQMEAFTSARTPSGLIKYGAPSGFQDDVVMARVMANGSLIDLPME